MYNSNDSFNNYQNSNMINNNSNNFNNVSNSNNQNNKSNILNIGLIIMLIIGIIFIVFTFLLSNDSNVQEESIDEEKNSSNLEVEQEPPNNAQEEIPSTEEVIPDDTSSTEEETKNETTPSTPTSLKCTKTEKNEYGTFAYTNTYKFSNNQMNTGTIKIKVTLKSSYRGYRDSLIQSLKEENKKFTKLDGISENVSKSSDGFTYTLKLNAKKLSKKELADMGYRTLNYSGVKIQMYNNNYKCLQ